MRKSNLSARQKKLLVLMQEVNFGWIKNFTIQSGEPVLHEDSHVIRKVKMGGNNRPRSESHSADFALKQKQVELFEELSEVGKGVIKRLEVRHGLPYSMEIQEPVRT